jgi:outer membrane lipoprotein-sorting protein
MSLALVSAGCHRTAPAERDAVAIVEKNVAARGGLKAWRAVRLMSMSGKMDAGKARDPMKLAREFQRSRAEVRAAAVRRALAQGDEANADADKVVSLPFVMEMQRPRKMRLEIQFQGQTAVQVFDGVNGWKLRPFLGRREVEPYTADEMRAASAQQELDGPLIDYSAKGSKVELEGTESVEGHDAYKLKLTLNDGQVRHVWVDAKTFLEVKVEGDPRRLDGKYHPVETYFRDYKSVDGLMIPHLIETSVEGVKGSQKITIERVALNPKLEDSSFTKPQ